MVKGQVCLCGARLNEGVMANQRSPQTSVVIINIIIHHSCPCPIDWHACYMGISIGSSGNTHYAFFHVCVSLSPSLPL